MGCGIIVSRWRNCADGQVKAVGSAVSTDTDCVRGLFFGGHAAALVVGVGGCGSFAGPVLGAVLAPLGGPVSGMIADLLYQELVRDVSWDQPPTLAEALQLPDSFYGRRAARAVLLADTILTFFNNAPEGFVPE